MSRLSDEERQELSLLLPWYANGTLDAEDEARVEVAIAQDEALAQEFELVLEDQASIIDLVSEEQVPLSMPERFKAALNAKIGRPEPIETSQDTNREGLVARLLGVVFPPQPRAYAAVAALVALALPFVAIVAYDAGRGAARVQYQTASGEEQEKAAGPRILVKFATGTAFDEIDALLRHTGGQIVKGPSADGLYEVAFDTAGARDRVLEDAPAIIEILLPAN